MCLQPYSLIPAYGFRGEYGEQIPEHLIKPDHTDDEILDTFAKLILKQDEVGYSQTTRYNRDMLIRAIRLVFWKARNPHATEDQIAKIPGRPVTFESMQFYRPNYTTDKVKHFHNLPTSKEQPRDQVRTQPLPTLERLSGHHQPRIKMQYLTKKILCKDSSSTFQLYKIP